MPKCKHCGDTGWITTDLGSERTGSIMMQMGVTCEIACVYCDAGKAELEMAKRAANKTPNN
ncbi:MAG: hypothetical protein KGJ13_09405 [Patescibacteria group bacterium]|nr:hypothetical protein [Patescibacteria group bacterium]